MKRAGLLCVVVGFLVLGFYVGRSNPPKMGHEGPRSSKWVEARAEHLIRQPTCMVCGTKDDLEVHHILPFVQYPQLELDPKNLITLCRKPGHNCHFVFGHLFSFYSWNVRVVGQSSEMRKEVKERP